MMLPATLATCLVIYTVGLDPLLVQAVRHDFSGAAVRRIRPIAQVPGRRRGGRAPDMIIIDAGATDSAEERAAACDAWGPRVVVVVERNEPIGRVWWRGAVETVEIGPGFLGRFITSPAAGPQRSPP